MVGANIPNVVQCVKPRAEHLVMKLSQLCLCQKRKFSARPCCGSSFWFSVLDYWEQPVFPSIRLWELTLWNWVSSVERTASKVHYPCHVDFCHRLWPVALPGFLGPELAGVPVCLGNHYDTFGRWLRHHICQSQSWFLVGRAASLHHQYSICAVDCIIHVIGCHGSFNRHFYNSNCLYSFPSKQGGRMIIN